MSDVAAPAMEARVKLTALAISDSEILRTWINDRDLVVSSAPYRPIHVDMHDAWFASVQRRTDCIIFAIRTIADDRLIGTCQLLNIHAIHRNAELQIRVGASDARGLGLGTEAISLLLAFAFGDFNLHRVHLSVFATNEAAVRSYEKAGFVREGVARDAAFIDGRYVDIVNMAIIAPSHF